MRIFNLAIYRVGPRGNMICIPFQVINELEWVPGDLLYCYPGKGNTLIYTKEITGEMSIGKYIININHTTKRVTLQKNWMDHHGLQPKDKISLEISGNGIVISLIKTDKDGENDGKE